MKRAVVVAALLVLAAVATWFALRGETPTPDAPATATAAKPDDAVQTKRTRTIEKSRSGASESIEIGDTVERASARPPDGKEPIAVGRLVDGAGKPIPAFDLVARVLDADDAPAAFVPCKTDSEGRFRFVLDRTHGGLTMPKLEIGHPIVQPNLLHATRRVALVDLPPTLPAGEIVGGDIAFRGTALLAEGVAVDETDRPLRGVEVRAMNGEFDIRSPTDDDAVFTDDSGRFVLRGVPPTNRVRLGAKLDGYCVRERPTSAIGAVDVRIVMSPAGVISGAVRIPPGQRIVTIGVSGPPADNGDTEILQSGCRRSVPDDDGVFEIRGLRPGAARVEIRLGFNAEDAVLTVDDVSVVAGQITRDPRLIDVDVRRITTEVNVVATDKSGSPLPARLRFRPSGTRGQWKESARGTATTIRADPKMAAGGLDVLVMCDGFRSTVVRGVRADTKVVLEPLRASVVRVRLKEDAPTPSTPFRLSAELHWIEPGTAGDEGDAGDPRSSCFVSASMGKDRVQTFEGVEPGRYRVVLFVMERDMNGVFGGSIRMDPKSFVANVGEDGAPVEVVVGVDADELARETKRSR
jgi:hypothetical protein